jgi:hypothetical protein
VHRGGVEKIRGKASTAEYAETAEKIRGLNQPRICEKNHDFKAPRGTKKDNQLSGCCSKPCKEIYAMSYLI